jgi:hypothetical protein
MHLPDDLVIVEPVDQAGRPVPPGTRFDTQSMMRPVRVGSSV